MGILLKLLFEEEEEKLNVLVVRCQPDYNYRKLGDKETCVVADFILPKGGAVANNYVKVSHGRTYMHQVQFSASETPSPNHFDVNVNFSKEAAWCGDVSDGSSVSSEVLSVVSSNDAGEKNKSVLETSFDSIVKGAIEHEKVDYVDYVGVSNTAEEEIGRNTGSDANKKKIDAVSINTDTSSSLKSTMVDEGRTESHGIQINGGQSTVAGNCLSNKQLGKHRSNLIDPLDAEASAPPPKLLIQRKRGRWRSLTKGDGDNRSELENNSDSCKRNTERSLFKPDAPETNGVATDDEKTKSKKICNAGPSQLKVNLWTTLQKSPKSREECGELVTLSTALEIRNTRSLLKKRAGCSPLAVCSICCKPDDLMYCDVTTCPRGYHLACLKMKTIPTSSQWVCPWHYCSESKCDKRHPPYRFERCSHPQCVLSYCKQHQNGNLFLEPNSIYLTCKTHRSQKTMNNDARADLTTNENPASVHLDSSQKNDEGDSVIKDVKSTNENPALSSPNLSHMNDTVDVNKLLNESPATTASLNSFNGWNTGVQLDCPKSEITEVYINSDVEIQMVQNDDVVIIDLLDDDD